ncbi:hypothetical protein POSPLADRAFT_1160337 [Postia placenta MAD-698-R-SB12]|uniref:Uncharacterized protein n=1 Tax=Postia placenta MAD-698-R-SB12 TaxID=670580 RepID=A0A1X6MIT4_9APHY|nr:hypothetical protein POSPLADRAFT_1160337 [Postia placenta MAD-698-R-SB12]OSX56248.1 hypothetical protein POSPLADRAFT_1160337 [Postia placenta MAD-698-R-SB12]
MAKIMTKQVMQGLVQEQEVSEQQLVLLAASNVTISGIRPSYDKNGNSYPTCGLTCAGKYKIAARGSHGSGLGHGTAWLCVMSRLTTSKQNLRRRSSTILDMSSLRVLLSGLCCISHLRHDLSQYSLFWRGRQHEMQLLLPPGETEASQSVRADVPRRVACKLPNVDHSTVLMVETKFNNAWKPPNTVTKPQIKYVYKIIESVTLTKPYDAYRCVWGMWARRRCVKSFPSSCNSVKKGLGAELRAQLAGTPSRIPHRRDAKSAKRIEIGGIHGISNCA